jgi:hypothetical protein
MFGLGKRDQRAVEVVREEMNAADSRARAVLADAMTQIESRLSTTHEETARLQASTQAAIDSLRYEVVSRPADIGPVLEQVAAMCALVAEKIEADRLERRALTEAIALLARSQPSLSEERSRVLGGTVLSSSGLLGMDDAVDREPAEPQPIDLEPVVLAAIDIEPVDREPIEREPVAARLVDEPVAHPVVVAATIDLVEEEKFETTESVPAPEVWNTFEKTHFDTTRDEVTTDVKPRQGTRLTAARRSNAGASWR